MGVQALTGEHLSPGAAGQRLEEMFLGKQGRKSAASGSVTIVLVDEMDLLVTRNQTVCRRKSLE